MLTLLLLLLYSSQFLYVEIPVTTLAIVGCLWPAARESPKFWFLVTATLVVGSLSEWYRLDNHKYLLAYWCLALFCGVSAKDTEHALATNARLLIGLAFLFSVIWKAASDDYLNGCFFEYASLFDERFRVVAKAGGISSGMDEFNIAARSALINYDSTLSMVQLESTNAVRDFARFLTFWTIGIEGVVAVLFLVPVTWSISAARDYLLILFVISTYAVAPVIGFAWLLCILGLAQCRQSLHVKALYVGCVLLLQVYRIPWQEFL